jgi:hypothetical protein
MDQKTTSHSVSRREFLGVTGGLLTTVPALALDAPGAQVDVHAQRPVAAPAQPWRQNRPAWWREGGLVMAGVDWESLLTRLRAGSYDFSQAFMTYDEKMALWNSEHSEALARRLKEMGFNFLMIPLYKGGGLKAERASLDGAKSFTQIAHRLGLRVGCYTSSGTILYETMLAEHPEAKDWFTLDRSGQPVTWGPLYYRYWANRIHPGFRALLRELIHFAVAEAKVDLVHLDNYFMGPGYEPYSVTQFREYLKTKYSLEERRQRFGSAEMDHIQPPPSAPTPDRYDGDPLYRDFVDFRCQAMADSFRELADYARSLNPEIVMEFNAGGYEGELIHSLGIGAVDHTRMLPWGGAFWDEGRPSCWQEGVLHSHFRTFLLGRYYNNMAFNYTAEPVAMAECMAHNLQCLGCPSWITGDRIAPSSVLSDPAVKEFHPAVLASIRFFHREQQHFRDTEGLADVGVLNTYANTAYGPQITRQGWAAFTQVLYQGKVPFAIVPDRHPGDLSRFRVLALPDLALISDEFLEAVRSYVHAGGAVVITGQTALFTEQSIRRKQAGLADLFDEPRTGQYGAEPVPDTPLHATPGKGRAVYIPHIVLPSQFRTGMLPENHAELLEAVRWAAAGPLQVEIKAPETVAMCLYAQPGGNRILHLVNYDESHPARDIEVTLQLAAEKAGVTVSLLSPDFEGARPLAAEQTGRALRFTVPQLSLYCMVVVG